MFEIGEDANVVDSYTNKSEPVQVLAVAKNKVTVIGWDFEASFSRKLDSFWNGDFYLEAA